MRHETFSSVQALVRALPFVLGLLFVAPSASGQSTGTILGVVKDPSGAVVPGAIATVRNVETALTRTVTTGADGTYRVPALPVGRYVVRVESIGFQSQMKDGIALQVAQEAVINVNLNVGATSEVVEVKGETQPIDTTGSSLGGVVDENKMGDLPLNGRNYLDLALLQTGVTRAAVRASGTNPGTNYSSNGAPSRSNAYLLDGAPQQNIYGQSAASAPGTMLGADGIREYKVVTNGFSAEYGGSMGSQTILVSKGGTNRFHGDIFEYLRNGALDARDYFDYSSLVTGRRVPKYQRNNFGAALGGPIVKDKTFFHAVYEGLREKKGIPVINQVLPPECYVLFNNPCAMTPLNPGGNVVPVMAPFLKQIPKPNLPGNQYFYSSVQPSREDYGQLRLDQQFSERDTFFGRYTASDGQLKKAEGFFTPGYPQFTSATVTRNQFITLSESHTFSPRLLNTIRLSFSRTAYTATSASSVSDPNLMVFPWKHIGNFLIPGMTAFGQNPVTPQTAIQNLLRLNDDVNLTRGKHALKMGIEAQQWQLRIIDNYPKANALMPPVPWVLNGQPMFSGIPNFLNGFVVGYTARIPGSNSDWNNRWYSIGLYAQDDWRVTQRVTLNLGLRYEFNTTPADSNNHTASLRNPAKDPEVTVGAFWQNASLKNFGPRVGFAWDVFGTGKTSLRGGFGMSYDISQYGTLLLQTADAMPPYAYQVSLPPGPLIMPPPAFNINNPVGSPLGPPANPSFYQVDYYGKQPYMMQYHFTIEKQLPGQIALSASYVGTRGVHLLADKEGNRCTPTGYDNGIPNWANTAGRDPVTGQPNGQPAICPWGRVNPRFGSIHLTTSDGLSRYNGLQVSLSRRLSKGLQFQSSYTYSRATDNMVGQYDSRAGITQYRSAPQLDVGPSSFDLTHNWRFNATYRFPGMKSNRGLAKLFEGWWMANIISVQTGSPFTVVASGNQSLSGDTNVPFFAYDRPNVVTPANIGSITSPACGAPGSFNAALGVYCDPLAQVYNPDKVIIGKQDHWFNEHMFTLQRPGYFGNAGYNMLRGPGFANWDFSINKDTKIGFLGESGMLQFRVEFFNMLNHSNFGMPDNDLASNPGVISESATGATPRDIQFALKLIW